MIQKWVEQVEVWFVKQKKTFTKHHFELLPYRDDIFEAL